MVIVKIWGGLGNQLFQYGFGKYLQKQLGAEVKFDVQTISNIKGFTQRNLQLTHFNLQLEIASAKEISAFKKFSNTTLSRIERKAAQAFPSLFKNYIIEPVWPYAFEDTPLRDNAYYDGYWQSYKYLVPNSAIMKNLLDSVCFDSEKMPALLKEIGNVLSVSMHVRRGDYLTLSNFQVCNIEYYKKAMQEMEKRFSGIIYYIFTDDLNWCRENFKGPQFRFVFGNEPFEDMHLMASCKHNIIANSTFSWWAAWCNKHEEKLVISPTNWHKRNDKNYDDLLPENWLRINAAKDSGNT